MTKRGQKQLEKLVFENQIDAVTRALVLVRHAQKMTIHDITRTLAQAEKEKLVTYLIAEGPAIMDANNHISLTTKGLERSRKKLPPEIEQHL